VRIVRAEPASTNFGFGLPSISEQYPLYALHLSSRPESPRVLAIGESELSLSAPWSNTAIIEDRYTIDAETRSLALHAAHSFFSDLEFGILVPINWRGGGVLDGVIDDWHTIFGLPRGDRRRLKDGSYFIFGQNQDGSNMRLRDDGFSFGNPEIGAKYLITPGSKRLPAFSYKMVMSLPGSKSGFGHDGIDLENELLSSKRFSSLVLYAGLSEQWVSDTSVAGAHFLTNHIEGFIEAEYELNSWASLVLGTWSSSEVIRGLKGHPRYSLYLDTGANFKVREGGIFRLFLRENPGPPSGTTDITFFSELTQSFH